MFKKLNKKGFTLAELLVLVAIIGVLVAISIPIFTSQLEKSREATDLANIRAAYAEASVKVLDSNATNDVVVYTESKMVSDGNVDKISDHIVAGKEVTSVQKGKYAKITVKGDESGWELDFSDTNE